MRNKKAVDKGTGIATIAILVVLAIITLVKHFLK